MTHVSNNLLTENYQKQLTVEEIRAELSLFVERLSIEV
jgi:hypothetical protein